MGAVELQSWPWSLNLSSATVVVATAFILAGLCEGSRFIVILTVFVGVII